MKYDSSQSSELYLPRTTKPSRSAPIDFVPPHDIVAEQSVIGAALIEQAAIDAARDSGLRAEDFYRTSHTLLWTVVEDMSAASLPVDFITVRTELEKRGWLEECGGISYLTSLFDVVPAAANAAYYASIVVHHAVRRAVCLAGAALVELGTQESDSATEVIAGAESTVLAISDKRRKDSREDSETIGRLLYHQYARSEAMHERGPGMLGLSTGLHGVDRLTSGMQSPDFIVIAGRPGSGKTSLLLHIALHIAIHHRRPVALFSLEMSKEQYASRIACMMARIDSHKLRMGDLTNDEWERYSRAVRDCFEAPLIINDSPACTVAEMSSALRRIRRHYGDLAFVGVDYLQLMSAKKGSENRTQAVSELSRDLKKVARTEGIPLAALSQLSRSVESRENKRPMLSDLRESGGIEADADLVAFLYNESYYDRIRNSETVITEHTSDEVEFIVGKHRNGATGNIKIGFQPTYTRFADITQRDDAPTGF